jgi:hypothetical protein
MKPIFTIHAGELLVADEIEQNFKKKGIFVWVPSKDVGIDLLVTDRKFKKSLSIQVKFSRDYSNTKGMDPYRKEIRACGWWTINRKKLNESKADIWVFVMYPLFETRPRYLVMPTKNAIHFFNKLHPRGKIIQIYIWVVKPTNKTEFAFETRDLDKNRRNQICKFGDEKSERKRNLSKYLNNWKKIEKL